MMDFRCLTLYMLVSSLLASACARGAHFPGQHWEVIQNPDAVGFSSDKLREAKEFAATLDTSALLVVANGQVVLDWGKTDKKYNSHSIRKSVLSALYGKYVLNPFETERILDYVGRVAPKNQAAKTAIDLALHDLIGKLAGQPVHRLFGLSACPKAISMTIGIDEPQVMAARALEYRQFKYLKIKLGASDDKAIIRAIREVSDQPFFIDANQGWKDRSEALEMVHWLKENNTVFIEQPMLKEDKSGNAWLSERSPLPIVADEGFQRLSDLREVSGIYHGINIKLMKSTGLREGFKMAVAAKAMGMKVMFGCMTETSCATSAGAQLMALADWVDLDGNLDVTNDPYCGATLEDGILSPTGGHGLGLDEPEWESIV